MTQNKKLFVEWPCSIYVNGHTKGVPTIRRYVVTGDGFLELHEEYVKQYKDKK